MCHIPQQNEFTFTIIKDLFDLILRTDKIIYVWGTLDELIPFTNYQFFSIDQISHTQFINLQDSFKRYWQRNHPHHEPTATSSADFINKCLCEQCIGKEDSQLWSLQDAVAFELNEWLDKRSTLSDFDIGLDPQLASLTGIRKENRKRMTIYAADDCLSMERLLIKLEYEQIATTTTIINKKRKINNIFNLDELESISSDDEDQPQLQTITTTKRIPIKIDEQKVEHKQQEQRIVSISNNPTNLLVNQNRPINPLSKEERRKIHNRSCTLKQRRRLYRYEIIKHNIHDRFTISNIKMILREHSIDFGAVNTIKSSRNGRTILYIGINNKDKLSEYELRLKHLFTFKHYEHFRRSRRSSYKDDRKGQRLYHSRRN